MKTSISFIIPSKEKIREVLDDYFIDIKKAKSKLNRLWREPFLSASLRAKNTPKIQDVVLHTKEISIEELCYLYPKRVRSLFAKLDLERKGLEFVKTAVKTQNLPAACKALIAYYQETDSNSWINNFTSKYSTNGKVDIDSMLDDTFTFQLVKGIVPRNDNGLLDWSHTGPENDKEWAWFFNRHYHLLDLFAAYQKTGNLEYVCSISGLITDWVISSPSNKSPKTWAQWRGLEVAFRIFHWASIFYPLQQVDAFTPVARILMLSSIIDHAHYLRFIHSWGANWICREMNSLATIALCWPEFKSSGEWFNYASQRLRSEINEQVYPDGVHKELTSHYHYVALKDFEQFANLLQVSGNPLSPGFKALERMWNYLAYSMRPDGHGVLNSDSDRDYNRSIVSEASTVYQRSDWTYITSNGEAGNRPNGEPSVFFPWAGQVIMRSGWHKLAHWAFFDIGPLGIYYHVHYDKLHLSISAYGRDLLVDSGRFRYVRDRFWRYFRDSAGHNVILIDGKGQKTDTKQLHKPIKDNCAIASDFDFAKGTYDKSFSGIKGKANHSRAVVYIRGKYWVVIDHIHTSKPRKIEPLWHFHPDCTVVIKGNSVGSIDESAGNLKILPASDLSWRVKLVKGQESPIQGWWSRQYNHKTPNPTAIYSTQIKESTTFAWVLFPSFGVAPKVTVKKLPSPKDSVILSIKIPGENEEKIAVRMVGDEVISLSENFKLDGDCAIISTDKKPLVANGCITDEIGNIIVEHNS